MTQQSNEDIQTEFKSDAIALPTYLRRQKEGLFVDLSLFPLGGGFETFVDRLFADGGRFVGLDYQLFQSLLFDYEAVLDTHGINAKLRLAADVVAFSPERKSLYKEVKIDPEYDRAIYFFEPVALEKIIQEPVYGEPGEDGVSPILSYNRNVIRVPAKLDLDEFISELWLKGVRFGIQIDAITGVIKRSESVRMDVALQLNPTEGVDAEIEEASTVLHRDNSPQISVTGKADLRKFQNRFPQISLDTRLLRKKPRQLGKPGFKVNGVIIEPAIPKDIDLYALAGAGTRVETQDGLEYIMASRDGFLALDTKSNLISITEKIENKGGISIRTTGDLSLTGSEYIEHGEVQEGRSVEGKNMTFHGDVYGDLVSNGGYIVLEGNLSGGSAKSFGGDILSNARAFNSILQAWEGKITVKYAESCVILAESVAIERAVNCEIIADHVQIDLTEGCGIAGKNVQIKNSTSCRGKQTVISMVVPNLTTLDGQIKQVNKAIFECQNNIKIKEQGVAQIKADPEVAKYLALAKSIQDGAIKLNEAQQENWNKMTFKFAKVTNVVNKVNADVQEQKNKIAGHQQELAHLNEVRQKSGGDLQCQIAEVGGDTVVRRLIAQAGISEFHKTSIGDIRLKLRDQATQKERIFSNSSGTVKWLYELPELTDLP